VVKAALATLAMLLVVGIVGFLWYAQPQPLLPEANAALSSTATVTFTEDDGNLVYTPIGTSPTTGLVLYPGGKVPSAAYAPQARAIADLGYLVVVVSVPFNLAVFGIDSAEPVIAGHPEIAHWVVGGHSLGGSMAAQFIDSHAGEVEGLVLWASYSAADLTSDGLAVLSAYGTLDTGVPSYTSPANLAKLGTDVTQTVIDGGNHEQMGWYTGQPNDPPATISRPDQQAQVITATVRLLDRIAGSQAAVAGRRSPSRSLATGMVAAVMPPMTRTTPKSWMDDGVSSSSTIARPIDMTGWLSRMIEVTIAGSRGSEIEMNRYPTD
jgi:pimeloyl-ACP methyl ester carboxylesterase